MPLRMSQFDPPRAPGVHDADAKRRKKVHGSITFLLVAVPKQHSPIVKMLSLTDSAMNLSQFGYWHPRHNLHVRLQLHYLVIYRQSHFSGINVSRGNVTTHASRGGTANLLANISVEEFWRSVTIWQNYGHEFDEQFVWPHHVLNQWKANQFTNQLNRAWESSLVLRIKVALHTITQRNGKCGTTIRYDTRCYFNVRSKANISQLNLLYETND